MTVTAIWFLLGLGFGIGFVGGFSVCCFLHCLEDVEDWQEMIDAKQAKQEWKWEPEPIKPV